MYYVYCKHTTTEREQYVNSYDTVQAAIEKIAQCYNIDKGCCQLGEYYYFMKQH